jgi:hypothetical protein
MRTSRGFVRFALAILISVSCPGRGGAQLIVIATPGDPPAVAYAELAYAEGAGPPVTWLSLRAQRGPVAVVAALPGDLVAEPALDAWFAALEATASPNVLLPTSATNCGQAGAFVHVSWPRAGGTIATELTLQSAEDTVAALAAQGLELSGELPAAERYLMWSWAGADVAQTTRTLRVVGGAAPLTLLPGASFPVLVSSVTRGATALPAELFNRELAVTFVADKRPSTDYRERLREFLDARPEPLLETRARGPLFDWSIYDDSVSLASLVRSYASRAQRELPELDADACSDQLRELRDAAAPSPAACGAAADASLALVAAGPELPTLQRFVVSGSAGFAPGSATTGGMPSAPVLRAELLDDSACSTQDLAPVMVAAPARSEGHSGPSGTTTVVIEETIAVDETQPVEVGCGGSPQPEPQAGYTDDDNVDCSSDTSSSSESESEDSDCSGDSSSSSDSSETSDGCASDSSSSSSETSDGCASDSSSSSSETSDGCSGGSDQSSGYDGDTCTGAAAPGAERAEKSQASLTSGARARRPRRMKTSLWSLACVAVILPIRRRKRGRNTSG